MHTISLLKTLAKTNMIWLANWFMHARVSVCMYVAIHCHAIWWLIDHDAHKASSYGTDQLKLETRKRVSC